MRIWLYPALCLALAAPLVGCGGGGGDDDDDTAGIDASTGDDDDDDTTCNGCFDDTGACVDGTADDACGLGGGACNDCGADTCSMGACVSTACSETCDGCCSGDTCLGGDATSACGVAGNACVDCGANRLCGDDGACSVDPASRWQIVAVDGTVPQMNGDGDPWDPLGGLPDPYFRVRVGGDEEPEESGSSTTASDTLTPAWDDIVLEDVPARSIFDAFALFVMDADTDPDDTIGSCGILVPESWFDGADIEQSCGDAVVRFRIRPQ